MYEKKKTINMKMDKLSKRSPDIQFVCFGLMAYQPL